MMLRLLGSLQIAVVLLVLIAGVLAWGTIYEARFGTAAVQRFVYTSWWFQALLGFLAVNLAVAALQRWPWQRRHTPFVLAHIGIILILVGGIIGSRFGVDGQLIIREGETSGTLTLSGSVLLVQPRGAEQPHVIPTRFETQAWVHEPHAVFSAPVEGGAVQLLVDRYYPDAAVEEEVVEGSSSEERAAVLLSVEHEGRQHQTWLVAGEEGRFATGWGQAHLVLVQPVSDDEIARLFGDRDGDPSGRGAVAFEFPDLGRYEVPVPWTQRFDQPVAIAGTPYTVTFKDYFPDFVIAEHGPTSRSDAPRNPAVAFVLSGPEGDDPHLAFAFHPDFSAMHGVRHAIHARIRYRHPAAESLPPNAIVVASLPSGALAAVLTGSSGERSTIDALEVGARYTHPQIGYQFAVTQHYRHARIEQRVTNRSSEVKREVLHLVARDGTHEAEAWLGLRGAVELPLGERTLVAEYRPAERPLPFNVRLRDFRKQDYPGIQMAAAFESDVELTDPSRGVTLSRTINMNNPLKYRGYSLLQSSCTMEPVETTILSVRNDPGTGFVYVGFLIVVAGIVSMFLLRRTMPQGGSVPAGD